MNTTKLTSFVAAGLLIAVTALPSMAATKHHRKRRRKHPVTMMHHTAMGHTMMGKTGGHMAMGGHTMMKGDKMTGSHTMMGKTGGSMNKMGKM